MGKRKEKVKGETLAVHLTDRRGDNGHVRCLLEVGRNELRSR